MSVDANTGSYLVKVDSKILDTVKQECKFSPTNKQIALCLYRMDWISKVLVYGSSGQDLINDIIAKISSLSAVQEFSLDYICMGYMREKDYTSKTLIYHVAHPCTWRP